MVAGGRCLYRHINSILPGVTHPFIHREKNSAGKGDKIQVEEMMNEQFRIKNWVVIFLASAIK